MQRVLVIGAGGRLGRAVATRFARSGWEVRALMRRASVRPAIAGCDVVEGDARHPADVIRAADGVDVIINAANPPFGEWDPALLEIADAVIAAIRTSGATQLFPGNLYNFGWTASETIDETTAQRPTTRKGAIRVEVERRFREAADGRGLRTIVLRAGDYFGPGSSGSWFDRVLAGKAGRGRMIYPGRPDVPHAWAYLPDYCLALEALARERGAFASFETFHFTGHTVTGNEMRAAFEQVLGRDLTVGKLPWRLMRLAGPIVGQWRELSELAYLWHIPHRLDGTKLEMALGPLPQTPLAGAVASALADLGIAPPPPMPDLLGRFADA
jgi:nucleoside-diphosphate-sugar epimerase